MFRVLLAAVALLGATAAQAQTPALSQPYISVTGEAEAKLAPDQAVLHLTARGEDKKLAAAKEQANKKLSAALAVAKKFGIEGDKLKTTYLQVNPKYSYVRDGQNNGKQVLDGYIASTSLELTLTDLSQLGALTDALVGAGIDNLNGVQFSLKDEKKAREDIMAKAVENARAHAEVLAKAAGAKVGRPLAISDGGGGVQLPVMPMAKMMRGEAMAASVPSPELPTGLIEVRQQVSATFALE